jgi:hypothetical protein
VELGILAVLNVDPESTAGACLTPLTYPQRFVMAAVVKPLGLALGLVVMRPLWDALRGLLPRAVWKMILQQAPPRISAAHMRRGVINVYLTVYAPITLQAIEMLVCKLPCDACDAEGEACAACGPVNVVDTGVACWSDDHMIAAAFAVVNLAIYCIVIPMVRVAAGCSLLVFLFTSPTCQYHRSKLTTR